MKTKKSPDSLKHQLKTKIILKNHKTGFTIPRKPITTIIHLFLKEFDLQDTNELHVNFTTKEGISIIHKKFFDDDSPTDCISFPIDMPTKNQKDYSVLGEIFICPQIALEYCTKKKANLFQEISLYLIHSLLHLIGYKDYPKTEKLKMKAEENKLISLLIKNYKNLWTNTKVKIQHTNF